MTGRFPKYLSMKRGEVIFCLLTMVVHPWRFLSRAYVLVEILSALPRRCSITKVGEARANLSSQTSLAHLLQSSLRTISPSERGRGRFRISTGEHLI